MLPLLLSLSLLAADPPPPGPVRLPAVARAADPTPGPDAVTRLTADRLFVLDSDVPVIVLTSPPGLVTLTEDAGPVKFRGQFADGTGRYETRTFAGKYVYTVEASRTGRVELIVVPVGAKTSAEVIRRVIEVDAGGQPQPPQPGPGPAPTPTPGPTTPTKLTVVVVEETADAVATRGALFSDPALNARMKAKGHGFRVVDKDVVGPDGKPPADIKRFLDRASGKALPQLFLVDEQGKARFAGDMAKTAAELLDLITRFGG